MLGERRSWRIDKFPGVIFTPDDATLARYFLRHCDCVWVFRPATHKTVFYENRISGVPDSESESDTEYSVSVFSIRYSISGPIPNPNPIRIPISNLIRILNTETNPPIRNRISRTGTRYRTSSISSTRVRTRYRNSRRATRRFRSR